MKHGRSALMRALGVLLVFSLLASGCLIKPGERQSKLTYQLPVKLTISAGGELPGTGMRYLRMSDKGAYVLIKGQEALKHKGDSLDWSGSPLPGVTLDLRLRIAWYTESEMYLIGTAKTVVEDANPRAMSVPTSSPIRYSGPVAYGLAKGATVPGSQLVFESQNADGVKISGVEGYPYRKTGDSVLWEGALRDRVYIRLDLRVLQFDAKSMRLGGLVTLWIGP